MFKILHVFFYFSFEFFNMEVYALSVIKLTGIELTMHIHEEIASLYQTISTCKILKIDKHVGLVGRSPVGWSDKLEMK